MAQGEGPGAHDKCGVIITACALASIGNPRETSSLWMALFADDVKVLRKVQHALIISSSPGISVATHARLSHKLAKTCSFEGLHVFLLQIEVGQPVILI